MKKISKQHMSEFEDTCVGCFDTYYVQAFVASVGKSVSKLSARSNLLDELNAYDLAELDNSYLGQINTVTVSSFCGIKGLIWGYDLYPSDRLRKELLFILNDHNDSKVKIYPANPLLTAAHLLFGDRNSKRFNLIHGSIVPCAQRKIVESGPRNIYGALALGIADNREYNADLIMEDIGILRSDKLNGKPFEQEKDLILENLARSIIVIGENHKVKYREIFVHFESLELREDEIGCILLIAPYFKIARSAILDDATLCLEDWNKAIEQKIWTR